MPLQSWSSGSSRPTGALAALDQAVALEQGQGLARGDDGGVELPGQLIDGGQPVARAIVAGADTHAQQVRQVDIAFVRTACQQVVFHGGHVQISPGVFHIIL